MMQGNWDTEIKGYRDAGIQNYSNIQGYNKYQQRYKLLSLPLSLIETKIKSS